MDPVLLLKLVVLLVLVHGAPVMAHKLLGARLSHPVDGGCTLADGFPLFGPSKTWRGLLAAVVVAALSAFPLDLGMLKGAMFGAAAMVGDLLSSFCKRRLGLASSSKATGLDQIPEAILPMLLGVVLWGYGWITVVAGILLFFVVEVGVSPLLFRLGIRRRPY